MIVSVYLVWMSICSLVVHGNLDPELSKGLELFSGLNSILSFFRNSSDPLAQNILVTFQTECFHVVEPIATPDDTSRKPFIVIDGNHRPSRDSMGTRLARMMDGRYLNNPAPCLIPYLEQLPAGSFLRRAYYALSLYANDFNVRLYLASGRSVVLNGCWLDQLTFSLVKTFAEDKIPPVTSHIYNWPSDLLQPDLTFYLALPDGFQTRIVEDRRPASSWQNRSMELYRALMSRYPIVMQSHRVNTDTVYKKIVKHLAHKRNVTIAEHEEETAAKNNPMEIFFGLEGVLEYFRNNSSPLAQRILETFENECIPKYVPKIPSDKSRKPFIVIEGNGHTSRDTIGKALARKINGRYMVHPSSCLVKFLDIMPKGTAMRRAYFVLSLYAASYNIKAHLGTNRAVVLNGYWLDQLTFSLIQTFPVGKLPPTTSGLFSFPKELLPPDLIFYLHQNDDVRSINPGTTNAAPNWYSRALHLYQSLQSTHPIVIENLIGDDKLTTGVLYKHIQDRLSGTRNFVFQDYEETSEVVNLFSGYHKVLNYFRNHTNPLARHILNTFERFCITEPEPAPSSRKPFIVIEGNNRTSRDMVGNRLGKVMKAVIMKHPAPCLREHMTSLPRSTLLRRAYYVLSLYATSMDIQRQVTTFPVFLNGYWLDQLTFALIQCFPHGRLPSITSSIFKWPENLMKPDLIIYLNHPDELYHKVPLYRSFKNWKPRAYELYQQLKLLYNIKFHDMKTDYVKTTDEIYQYIVHEQPAIIVQ